MRWLKNSLGEVAAVPLAAHSLHDHSHQDIVGIAVTVTLPGLELGGFSRAGATISRGKRSSFAGVTPTDLTTYNAVRW
jgi:hypothetical protein